MLLPAQFVENHAKVGDISTHKRAMSTHSTLNPEQQKAIETTDGPVLIIAGAGSGKTKTLTHRIAHLIQEKSVPPRNILAVTFTNKAAGEMRERISQLLAPLKSSDSTQSNVPHGGYALPHIGTFHSISARILRKDIEKLGYRTSFGILDADDQLALMKRVMKSLEIDPKQIHPRALLDAVSRAKNKLIDERTFEERAGSHFESVIARAYRHYQEELRWSHTLDFDDLLMLVLRLFSECPEVLDRYRELYRYVLVDEYQDTNHAQYLFLHLLAKEHRNIFAIGDDYQSIYGWRQADIRNILEFEKDYPEATLVTLDRNYRSTQVILDAAGAVIEKNSKQRHKKLWTSQKGGSLISLFEAEDEASEAHYVAQTIGSITRKDARKFSDFAVLYRTNAQSRAIEEAFLREDIPYNIVGGLKFYQRKEVKDAISYLRLSVNLNDSLSLSRIANEPTRGIGKKSLATWLNQAKTAKTNPIALARQDNERWPSVAESKKNALRKFSDTIWNFSQNIGEYGSLSEFLLQLLNATNYLPSLDDGSEEGKARSENVRELISVAKKFDAMPTQEAAELLLEEIALVSDSDSLEEKTNSVKLMTIHSAKGLEFPIVFMTGLEEGIFPHSRSTLSPSELEEERRLMYVGLTRAKEQLFLISAETRLIFGATQMNAPSRFLADIPKHLTKQETWIKRRETQKSSPAERRDQGQTRSTNISKVKISSPGAFRPGDTVSHPVFGNGVIIKIDGTLASIAFRKSGVKKLALGIAPLEKV